MGLGSLEVQIFVSLAVILATALIALIVDYLKGSNERLREHNIELRARQAERDRLLAKGWVAPDHRPAHRHREPAAGSETPQTVVNASLASGAAMNVSLFVEPQGFQERTAPAKLEPWPKPEDLNPAEALPPASELRIAQLVEPVGGNAPPAEEVIPVRKVESPAEAPVVERPLVIPVEPEVGAPHEPSTDVSIPPPAEKPFGLTQPEPQRSEPLPVTGEPTELAAETHVKAPDSSGLGISMPEAPPEPSVEKTSVDAEDPAWLDARSKTTAALRRELGLEISPAEAPREALPRPTFVLAEPVSPPANGGSVGQSAPGKRAALPAGLYPRAKLDALIEEGGLVDGLVVALCINNYELLVASMDRNGAASMQRSVAELVAAMAGKDGFAARYADDEFVMLFPGESGVEAERHATQISELLWDYQIRSLSRQPLTFSWASVQVAEESLEDAISAARAQMNETKRRRAPRLATHAFKPRAVNL